MKIIIGLFIAACLATAGALMVLMANPSRAADLTVVSCKVTHVTDGDTFRCIMNPPLWGPYRETQVRVSGIDTPESRKPPAKCIKEVRFGKIATFEMRRRAPAGSILAIQWTGEREKYGRVLAVVTLPDGKDWASEMIRIGMARTYDGGKKSKWCK